MSSWNFMIFWDECYNLNTGLKRILKGKQTSRKMYPGYNHYASEVNSFLASDDFRHLLIIFADSLDPGQDRQNVG